MLHKTQFSTVQSSFLANNNLAWGVAEPASIVISLFSLQTVGYFYYHDALSSSNIKKNVAS